MTCINTLMYHLKALHLGISLMTKTILHKLFVRTIDSLYVSINYYPQHVLYFFYIFILMCNAFLFCQKKQDT